MGAATYPALQAARSKGWCKFVEATPQSFHESLLRMRGSQLDLPQQSNGIPSPYYLSSAAVSEDEGERSDEDVEAMQSMLPGTVHDRGGVESGAPS